MLKRLKEFGKYIQIAGFKNAKITDVESLCKERQKSMPADAEVQFFNADRIATWQHLYFAVVNAVTAFEKKTNASRSPAMEIMLFASARHQIKEAISAVGIKPGCSDIAVVIVGDSRNSVKKTLDMISRQVKGKRCDRVLELTPKKRREIQEEFEVSTPEFEAVVVDGEMDQALVNLIVERVALVSTYR